MGQFFNLFFYLFCILFVNNFRVAIRLLSAVNQ